MRLSLKNVRRSALALNKRTVGTGLVVAVLSTTVVIAAVRADGARATNVQLDDGSVWVSNQSLGRIGRLNIRVDELDLEAEAGSNADVVQEGRNVYFTGADGGVRRMDVVSGQATPSKNTINLIDYQVNGGIALLHDPTTGKVWVGRSGSIVGADFPKKADAQLKPGSKVVVTVASADRVDSSGDRRGKVLVADSTGWYELALDENYHPVREPSVVASAGSVDGTAAVTTTAAATSGTLPEAEPEPIKTPVVVPLPVAIDESTTATAVGDRLVFLNSDGTLFSTDGKAARIPGDKPLLQPSAASNGDVLVSSSTGLFAVKIGTDKVTQLSNASGVAAAPVRVGSCVYGAWSSAKPVWFKQCGGTVVVDGGEIPNAAADEELVYRVNQNNVALNAVRTGEVWADHDGTLAYVGNWEDADPNAQPDTEQNTGGQVTRVAEKQCVEGSEAPTVGNDQLGARPRQTIIDVLYNDDDPNCEPIGIESVDPSEGDWGQLTIIDNGQHLLFSPSQEIQTAAASSIQPVLFTYTVADSTGNISGAASVTLSVKDVKLGNDPPALRPKQDGTSRAMRTVVEEGRTISYNVLADWWDPDGDDLRLDGAVPQERGEVSTTPDGVVRYSANGVSASVQQVDVTLSDGAASTVKPLEVTVKPSGSAIPPITSNDFITLVEGAAGTVFPLANDSDPNESKLALVPKWPTDSANFRVKTNDEGIEITAVAQGTYALKYEASDGTDSTGGTIRLVVLKPDGSNHAPIAVPDQVKLRPDRVVNVDVLANDIDADGDILAVSAVDSSGQSGAVVRASIIDRRLVQVEVVPGSDGLPPKGTFFVSYNVDDGRGSERAEAGDVAAQNADVIRGGGVISVSIVPPSSDQPPVTNNDSAVVRTGDIVAVPVLTNDVDPDGDALTLTDVSQSETAALELAGDGIGWVSGRSVYFKGGKPGSTTLHYSVIANGKEATGEVSFTVRPPPDAAANPNSSPAPRALILRAVRGATVRLPIPLFGVDTDGDSVTLLSSFDGLQGAAQGNAVELDPENPGVALFTAGQSSGPADRFDYSVRDAYGATGTATVTVVVLDNKSWPPAAHDDVFRAKPGRSLTIPVLANDTSPQDNRLELAEAPFFDADGQQSASPVHPDVVKVLDQSRPENRGRIEVTVPADGSSLSEHYRITDGKSPADAFLRVTPDPTAPNMPPVATVDVVKTEDIAGKDAITVNVLINDYDPDDDRPVTVSIPANENATSAQGVVSIPLAQSAQIVLYRLTDADGAATIGIVRVPGKENHPPVLTAVGKDPAARTIEAGSTQPLTIRLADIVEDPDKDPSIRLTATEVEVLGGQGSVSRLESGDGFIYAAPPDLKLPIQATIEFEVTDRPDSTDAERQVATCNCLAKLSIAVTVQASSPPRILSQGNVTVPQLDEEVVYDLAPLVVDDQGDQLQFVLLDANPGGLDAQLNGSTVTLVSHLADDALLSVGTPIVLHFTVTDQHFDAVEGLVNITIVATNKGRPAAATFADQQAERGISLSLPNLLASATNPSAPRPLTLLSPLADGGATVSCAPTGDCQFRSDSVGTFHVSYTLKDAVNQTAPGTLTVVVKGKPLAPGVPTIGSVGDHVVNLSWTAADMQGGVFKTYHVTAVEAGRTMDFTATGGQFTGLTNGTPYHFTVVAENELGVGDASLQSSAGTPDRVPDPPINPAFTAYGDATLSLQWAPPATAGDFTPIQKYEIAIGGQTLSTDGGVTTLVVSTGLQNGTDYTFKVRAQNKATTNNGWGEWSVLSAPERPSRAPDAPGAPTATSAGDGGSPRLTVQWAPPSFDGGRPITQYKVCRVQDAANCQTISSGLQATFALARNLPSSFTVIAYNSDIHKNDSAPSAPSAVTTTVGNPDTPVISSVQSLDHTLVVTASSANQSGCSTYSLEYSLDGGASWQSSATFGGLNNGVTYTATAKAVLPSTCGTAGTTYESAASAGVSETPYGPLVQPTMNVTVQADRLIWTWSENDQTQHGRAYTTSVSGVCAGQASGFTQVLGPGSASQTCTITVSANGVPSLSDTKTAATPPPPSPSLSVGRSGSWVTGNGANFPANNQYWITCSVQGSVFVNTQSGFTSNGPVSFAPRFVAPNGTLSWGTQICFSAPADGPVSVHVWTSSGPSADASTP